MNLLSDSKQQTLSISQVLWLSSPDIAWPDPWLGSQKATIKMSISAEVSTKTQLEKALVLLAEWKFCDTGSFGFLPAIGGNFLGSRSCHEPLAMWAPNIGSPGLQRQQGERERLQQDGCCDVNKTILYIILYIFHPIVLVRSKSQPHPHSRGQHDRGWTPGGGSHGETLRVCASQLLICWSNEWMPSQHL